HFIFTCPLKFSVWRYVWRTFVDPSTPLISYYPVIYVLSTLKSVTPTDNTNFLQAFVATLEFIWSSHWAYVFNDTPFTVNTVISSPSKKIMKASQETFIIQGIPHIPLPFINTE
ncbi:uncharacterized protein BX663DRAFT_428824, partial [Cokeromyces recurvatus]|uniref:uncharacterized protein n=1 Tax=Cokeromyces recurvatus TaxID=90255 RepID=UPI0022207A13